MQFEIPADVNAQIDAHFSTGRYASREDVLREALEALRHWSEELTAIRGGIADMEAGRVRPFAEFDREFRERHGMASNE